MLLVLDDFLQQHLVEFTIHNQSFRKQYVNFRGNVHKTPTWKLFEQIHYFYI